MNTDVTVSEVMDREFVGVTESDGVLETVELLLQEEVEVAVVLRGQDPVGVFADRDALALLVADDGPDHLADATVGEVMTEEIPSVDGDASLAAARDRMTARDTRWLIVTDGAEPAGVLTEHDLLTSSTLDRQTGASEAESVETSARRVEAGREGAAGSGATEGAGGQSGFEDQSICEKCGSLAHDLSSFNGQLLCADCRDI